jgi:hypothetical protein
MNRTLAWIQHNSIEEIVKWTPDRLKGNDAALFAAALRASFPTFPPDGRFDSEGVKAVRNVLTTTGRLDLSKTYTNEFVASK